MKRIIFFLSIVIVLGLISWYVYSRADQNSLSQRKDQRQGQIAQAQAKPEGKQKAVTSKKAEEPKTTKKEAEVTPVQTQVVSLKPFTAKIQTVGTSKAKEDYVLSAKLNGEITYLYGDIGTLVKKGTVLAKIDPEMVEANYRQAEANYQMASNTYSRQKKLAAKKLISAQQLEGAETQFKIAQATLRLAKINLKNSKITSPITGVIAEKYANLHEFTTVGRPAFRVVNTDKIEMQVGVSERNIVKLKAGNKAFLQFSSYPGDVFEGRVTNIGLQADEDTKTFPVKIEVKNADRRIKGGMIADISIFLNTYPQAVVIPFYLLQQAEKGGYYVYIEKDGKANRRDLMISEIQDDIAHVIEGLSPGDNLIVEGNKYVNDGTNVSIQN